MKGLLVLALPVLALLAMGIANLVVGQKLAEQSRASTATTASIAAINRSLELALDAETGVRGYAATGNPVFLQPYNQAIKELTPLKSSSPTIDGLNRAQTKRLRTLGMKAFLILTTVKAGIAAGTLHGQALEAELLSGKAIEDQLRAEVTGAQMSQRADLAAQQHQVDNAEATARYINIAGLIVGIVAGLLAMLLFLQGVIQRIAVVERNTAKFLDGEEMDRLSPSGDEIGRLQSVLLRAAGLLTQRERELQTARDEAITATRAKDNFLGRMSHELRTPLTAVLGFGQLLQMEDLNEEDADSVNHIVSAGEHLLSLIEDLLDIARIETDHLSLSLEPILLDDVVADSIALMGPLAAARHVTIEERDLGAVVVRADRQRLKQVLLNLLSNAIKYNRDGGTIVVSCHPGTSTTMVLTVADTGMGIAQDGLGRLFEPFDRLGAESTGVEGTGVGLSLSKALTEAMHGTIEARSEQGVGSTFSVTLPADALDHVDVREEPADPRWPAGRTSPNEIVLYAEDNLASLRVVERIFSRRAETLEVAIQGNLVLDLARVMQPRLIILDLHLPDMSGEEVLNQLHADPETTQIPVVMLSADTTPGQRRRLLAQGATAYLTKPLNVPEFLEILDRLAGPAA